MTEFYEDFRTAALGQPFPPEFNGWDLFFGSRFTVLQDGVDRVLVGKGTDTTSKRMLKPIIGARGFGRVEGKLKLNSNVAADYSAQNNFAALGFVTTGNPEDVTGATKRVIQLTYEAAGANVGLKFWNGSTNALLLAIADVPVDTWLTLGVATDGTGRYTAYILNEATGDLLGTGSYTIAADAGIALHAYVDIGWNQKTQDAQGWGTQYKWKDIIARDDFTAYDTVSQRRHIRFAPTVNGGDICYVVIPKDWKPDQTPENVILAGHGYNAPIGFETMLSDPFPDAGFIYGQSNTHGNTWGNTQAQDDIEAMRLWVVQKCGASGKVNLYGASMGCLVALNYAANRPEKVLKIVAEVGVTSLQPMYKQATYTDSIKTAYGVTRFGDIPKAFDPIRNPEKFVGIPIMHWVGTADTVAVPALQGRIFADKVSLLGGSVMYIEEPGETHNLDVDPQKYIDFYNANKLGSNTKLIWLDANTTYKLTSPVPGAVSYCLDSIQGAMTLIQTAETSVRSKGRPMLMLLKSNLQSQRVGDVRVEKVGG